jgi:hypothetical protein
MRTGTRNRQAIYKQCENEKCKATFYVPPSQPNLRCCSLECRTARKAQERANGGWKVRVTPKPRRDAVGLRKGVFDDSALVAVLQPAVAKLKIRHGRVVRAMPED